MAIILYNNNDKKKKKNILLLVLSASVSLDEPTREIKTSNLSSDRWRMTEPYGPTECYNHPMIYKARRMAVNVCVAFNQYASIKHV